MEPVNFWYYLGIGDVENKAHPPRDAFRLLQAVKYINSPLQYNMMSAITEVSVETRMRMRSDSGKRIKKNYRR